MERTGDWRRRKVTCDICDATLSANSLDSHLQTQHGVFRSRVIDQCFLVEEPRRPVVYKAVQAADGQYFCPVPGCPGSATRPWNMRLHFARRHIYDRVYIPKEGMYPRCRKCGVQTNPLASEHERSQNCRREMARRLQHEAARDAAIAQTETFTAYEEQLERVEVFKYLGRLLAYDDDDGPTILANLRKARKCWARISKVLRAENASPRVSGLFYRATVQAVLLFGSETWNLTGTWLKRLEGFHLRAAWRMSRANKPRRNPDGSWVYPPSVKTLEEVGLQTIEHYVLVRRQTIADFIVNRPIFGLCVGGERRRGTSPRQWWWEQPMSLDAASGEGDDEEHLS